MMKILLCVLLLTLTSNEIFSQIIHGKITDVNNSEPLVGAVVKVQGTNYGAVSDLDGTYRIENLKPDTYTLVFSYIGYISQTVENVIAKSDEETKVDVILKVEGGIETEEITVESNPSISNDQSLLIEQKNSTKIQDGISEQQIKRAPNVTASDALKRVLGVNVVDNKFVFVRGITERYNNTTLNGVLLPSTESDKRSFSFDLFPSKFLENIIVAKSFTADLPGNFAGGLVQLNTLDYVERLTISFETIGTYATKTTTEGNYYHYDAGQKQFLFFNSGIDNGGRSIPSNFPSTFFSGPNNYGKTLVNSWGQTNYKAPLNGGFQLSIGDNLNFLKNPLSLLLSYTYRNGFVNDRVDRATFNSDTTTLINVSGRTSAYSVLNGGMLNMIYKIGNNNKLSFKNTMSINSDDRTQYFEGVDRIETEYEKQLYNTIFTERGLFSTQVGGNHYIDNLNKLNASWYLSYAESKRNEPDTKTNTYQRVIGDETQYYTPLSTIAFPRVGQRFYSYLNDFIRTLGANFDMQFVKTYDNQRSRMKYGLLAVGTDRSFQARNFGVINSGSFLLGFQSMDSIFSSPNIDSTKISVVETTNKSDAYSASEDIYAGYLSFDFPFKKLRAIAGLRYEYSEQRLNGFLRTTQDPVYVSQINNDLLPTLSLAYSLNDKTNIRASATQTVSRPELRELAPFGYIDFITGGELAGNPDLQESLIQNYDLRYETFPDAGEIVSLSLFYKNFEQPIEKIIVPTSSGDFRPSYSYSNAINGANNYGLEIELRKTLGFISKYAKDFTFNGNLTLVNSTVNLEGIQQGSNETERRMQGQSPYILNLGLFYDNYDLGLSANLSYNNYGEKISEVGKVGFYDVYEQGRSVLDLLVSKTFLNYFEGKFSIRNILAEDQTFTQKYILENGEEVFKEVYNITTNAFYSISLSYKF